METDKRLYFLIRDTLEAFAKIYNRLEVSGLENIPDEGGAVICPSHSNYSDPFFVAVAVKKRVLHFLAWHGIEEMPLLGALFKRLGVMHPIRESYGEALDKEQARVVLGELEALLRSGEMCVVFPEGAIKHWIGSGRMRPFKHGAVRLAAQAGAPIIPAGLAGTRWVVPNIINLRDFNGPDKSLTLPLILPAKVRVKFGEPFYPDPAAASDKIVLERETERLRLKVIDLVESLKNKK
ncbi:MAG: lysophospholipid acyltransferase family protein [bacterium]